MLSIYAQGSQIEPHVPHSVSVLYSNGNTPLPFIFHADHRPATLLRLGHQSIGECGNLRICSIGIFTVSIVGDGPASSNGGPSQPAPTPASARQPVELPNASNRAPSYEHIDALRFAGFVIDPARPREFDEYRLPSLSYSYSPSQRWPMTCSAGHTRKPFQKKHARTPDRRRSTI